MEIKCDYKKEFKKYREDINKGCYKSYSDQFDFFYNEYTKELNENPEFDFSVHKSMLQFKVNNRYESVVSIYISGVIAIVLFYSSTVGQEKFKVYIAMVLAAMLTIGVLISLLKANVVSDMWNVALIALETLEKENEEKEVNKSLEDIKRVKQFLDIK